MTRILLVLMAVMGLNAAEVPAMIGDQLSSFGGAGGEVASAATGALGSLLGGVASTGISAGKVTQASVMRTGSFNMVKTQPINVARSNVAARRGSGLGGISF
jgi:hypothetical protein